MNSVAVIPSAEFHGEQKSNGMLRADAYWHGEIVEMRKGIKMMQVKLSKLSE